MGDYPGFLGFTSKGVVAMHADWPTYPEEHGADIALLWLTAFPKHTAFKCIDDIDQCVLLLADEKVAEHKDLVSPRNLHVAIWHEDLLALAQQGYIEGVVNVSRRQWEVNKKARVLANVPPGGRLGVQFEDGTWMEIQWPSMDEYDDERQNWPEFQVGGIVVTDAGRARLAAVIHDFLDDGEEIGPRIAPLLKLGYFDTAVREGCIVLEQKLKTLLGSVDYGESLVEEFCDKMRERRYIEATVRTMRAQLRLAFKFIRNDVMHNYLDMDELTARSALFRIARFVRAIDHELTKWSSR